MPMLRAAIHEPNPSANGTLVDCCLATWGPRRVNEALLDFVEKGTDLDKQGAVSALYWAHFVCHESRDELADVWLRRASVLLKEFIVNTNLHVRRNIIALLALSSLEPSEYLETLKPLIAQAIAIARTHPDEYIRQRVGELRIGLAPPRDC